MVYIGLQLIRLRSPLFFCLDRDGSRSLLLLFGCESCALAAPAETSCALRLRSSLALFACALRLRSSPALIEMAPAASCCSLVAKMVASVNLLLSPHAAPAELVFLRSLLALIEIALAASCFSLVQASFPTVSRIQWK